MIITRSSVTAAAARWATLGRIYHKVDGQRRRSTETWVALSAMLSRDRGRRAVRHHGNDSNSTDDRISSSCRAIALALPYYYYYCYHYYLVDDEDENLVRAGTPKARLNIANDSEASANNSDDRLLLNRQDGLRCCA
ncbi:uncharacterized protein LOC114936825 [Nylanderia fulva]|uniref:uncharacterized protein LOC114936825 n=1 Tax=Nylanderia fulva TaxID=613905 RepID=UPI0010FB1445|nr:uncharacterized protein LOC114936825 [Nylanderia fulva]